MCMYVCMHACKIDIMSVYKHIWVLQSYAWVYVCMYVCVYSSYLEEFANEYGAGFVAVQ